uniref:Uncharacterized protein n=1 Tax=Arundo donax TaxID=35708 RepID=A0A0A8YRL6_ARUDO
MWIADFYVLLSKDSSLDLIHLFKSPLIASSHVKIGRLGVPFLPLYNQDALESWYEASVRYVLQTISSGFDKLFLYEHMHRNMRISATLNCRMCHLLLG